MTDHSALIERLEAAMSREGKPRGDHMTGAYAAFAVSALESGDEDQAELASVYDAASRCIANETAMFDALSAVAAEAAAALRDLTERLSDANQSICAFAAPWAATYARDFGLPEGSLHATHFDILEAAGARMVSFTRHDPSAPNQAKEAGE